MESGAAAVDSGALAEGVGIREQPGEVVREQPGLPAGH